jgi:hypothetical protein
LGGQGIGPWSIGGNGNGGKGKGGNGNGGRIDCGGRQSLGAWSSQSCADAQIGIIAATNAMPKVNRRPYELCRIRPDGEILDIGRLMGIAAKIFRSSIENLSTNIRFEHILVVDCDCMVAAVALDLSVMMGHLP